MTGTVFDIKEFAVFDGPGIRTTVFLKGCPLRCQWCHNPEGLSPKPQLMVSSASCVHCGACSRVCKHPDNCIACGVCVPYCRLGLRKIAGTIWTAEALAERLQRDADVYQMSGGGVTFSGGEPLMQWDFDGIFRVDIERCNMSQWECCDLLYFEQADKWVAVVSINPNGYITGSSTMYFVGSFDGVTFTPDADEYPRWLDYGADCYAGVTFDNAPDNRKVMIAWMNNWDYAPGCPPTAWKGAYTMPRELSLRSKGGHWVLCSEPVKELSVLAGPWQDVADQIEDIGGDYADAWEAQITLSLSTDATIKLSNQYGNEYVITVNASQRRIYCNRGGKTGESNFSTLFAVPSMSAPIEGNDQYITLDIIVDQSSVELFAGEGSTCFTNNVYPRTIYRNMQVDGAATSVKVRTLETIWKN